MQTNLVLGVLELDERTGALSKILGSLLGYKAKEMKFSKCQIRLTI